MGQTYEYKHGDGNQAYEFRKQVLLVKAIEIIGMKKS